MENIVYVGLSISIYLWMMRNNYIAFTRYKKYFYELNLIQNFLMKKIGLELSIIINSIAFFFFVYYIYLENFYVPAIFMVIMTLFLANIYETGELVSVKKRTELMKCLDSLFQMEEYDG